MRLKTNLQGALARLIFTATECVSGVVFIRVWFHIKKPKHKEVR